jgi:hypothetical protein
MARAMVRPSPEPPAHGAGARSIPPTKAFKHVLQRFLAQTRPEISHLDLNLVLIYQNGNLKLFRANVAHGLVE